ncbi:MAG: ribH [Planctomycetaceae bacterium]|nr:ribH [Planctomycetaceae bacterium]
MPQILSGRLIAGTEAYAIVVARFNDLVTQRLLDGALDTLRRHGVAEESITVAWVPGSFEIPLAAEALAKTHKFGAVICLGAVIQGQTTHHEYINHQVAAGIMRLNHEYGIPVSFGVLTCQTMEQALDRAGGKAGNKGHEAALAAIEMVQLLATITPGQV